MGGRNGGRMTRAWPGIRRFRDENKCGSKANLFSKLDGPLFPTPVVHHVVHVSSQ